MRFVSSFVDEKGLRELLLQRLHMELLLFKDSMFQKEKEDIFMDSYRIEIYVNLYEILVEHADTLGADTMRMLLNLNYGILETVYQKWMGKKDSFYDELNTYVCNELESVSAMADEVYSDEKEGDDGTGYDQAA